MPKDHADNKTTRPVGQETPMSRRKELVALSVAAAIAVVFLIGFLFLDMGQSTAPMDRVDEQNSGVNAPSQVAPSPDGTEN
jgi:hypothetical protein